VNRLLRIFGFSMREFDVEEDNPSLAAAPLGPDTKHDDRGRRALPK
jgi:hypothetical protein